MNDKLDEDFICHLCRREFGIDATDDDNFRNRSDMYCPPCFHSGRFPDYSIKLAIFSSL